MFLSLLSLILISHQQSLIRMWIMEEKLASNQRTISDVATLWGTSGSDGAGGEASPSLSLPAPEVFVNDDQSATVLAQ